MAHKTHTRPLYKRYDYVICQYKHANGSYHYTIEDERTNDALRLGDVIIRFQDYNTAVSTLLLIADELLT